MVNGVDLRALLTFAWYVDQQITIKVPIEFHGPVVFEVCWTLVVSLLGQL